MLALTLLEIESDDRTCQNVGTIQYDDNVDARFKTAVETHFDGELVSYSFTDGHSSVTDCFNAVPIDVDVVIKEGLVTNTYKVEVSQTWMY